MFSLLRQCCGSVAADREEPSNSAIYSHAPLFSQAGNHHAPPPSRRGTRSVGGTRRWRPALSAISEDGVAVIGVENARPAAKISHRKPKAQKLPFSQRVRRAWNCRVVEGFVELSALSPTPFMG